MMSPLPNDALPSRERRRRLSGSARIALVLWVLSVLEAIGIMVAAVVGAHAAAMEPISITVNAPSHSMLGVTIVSGAAIALAVAAIILAASAHRPRGGI